MKREVNLETALRVARSLIYHPKSYKDYNLAFQNWYDGETSRANGARASPRPTRVEARRDRKDYEGRKF